MSKAAKKVAPAKTPITKNPVLMSLIVVLAVAAIVIVVLFARSNSLNSQLDALNTELTDTNAAYQQTVSDKEAVEEQLNAAEESLREAKATLEESTAKVVELEGQLTALTEENNANKAQIATLTADLETAKANKEAAEVYLSNVETSIQLALNALNGVTPAPVATAEPAPEVIYESIENTPVPVIEVTEEAPAVEEPTAEPAPEVTEEAPAVEPETETEPVAEPEATDETTEEVPAAEPETDAEPVAEPEVTDETTEEVPAAEPETETEAVTEPEVTDETAKTPVDAVPAEPLTEAEVIAPVVTPNEDGTYTVALNEQTLTVSFDENMAIKTLVMADVDETLLAQFIGKTLPLDVTTLTLDEAGVAANIAQLLSNASFPVTLPAEDAPAA